MSIASHTTSEKPNFKREVSTLQLIALGFIVSTVGLLISISANFCHVEINKQAINFSTLIGDQTLPTGPQPNNFSTNK
jgi:hypothetical protein